MTQKTETPEYEKHMKNLTEDPLTDQHRARIWCKVMRLTESEGLEYMRKRGYDIKKDRYNQLMTQINRSLNKRLLYEAQVGFIEQHFASIDLIENLIISASRDLHALEDQHTPKVIYAKTKLRDELAMNIPLLTSYRERTQYVMELQLQNRKLVKDVGSPKMVAPDSIKLTKEMAAELGIDDYTVAVPSGGAPHTSNTNPHP